MKKTMIPTKDRPTTMISLRIPVDVLEQLKKVAPAKGMSGYQALIKYYVGKGLREDFDLVRQMESAERLESTLTRMGLKPDQINEVWDALRGYLPEKSEKYRKDKSHPAAVD
ncbi:MAG: hypothetical protein HY912_01030 [Desulfomonile tiedjei]|uniref:Uncharacterized protein n=1 Tax=Desulfomonile tiedjei TaxID=2358 RepID=A0A9D6V105_9BACT|nr:hypothetical protein [Desulfomonile tiedjei]